MTSKQEQSCVSSAAVLQVQFRCRLEVVLRSCAKRRCENRRERKKSKKKVDLEGVGTNGTVQITVHWEPGPYAVNE